MAFPIGRVELVAKEPTRIQAFLGQLFGWTMSTDPVLGYTEIDTGGAISAAITQARAQGPSYQMAFYIDVANLDEMVKRAKDLGGTVLMLPRQFPKATVALVTTPEGHAIGLVKLPARK
jgi:uncharacterized protein